ncbi:MAG: NDP-sugar synthase [Acidimicrobiales bacterium]
MKAFLLAAGTGSRLRPITDHIPKCMLPIGGTPLLDLWLDALHRAEVDEVLINLHHLPDMVLEHLQARKLPPAVHTAFEPELLGSAGTLRQHRSWVEDEEFFLALNADNLTDFDLRRLIDFHRSGDAVATLTVFPAEDPSRYGVVDIDQSGLVTGFSEKPPEPIGNLANAGMYAFSPSLLLEIHDTPPSDIGYQLLPRLVGRARALTVDGFFCDIGTPASYSQAIDEWQPKVLS